MSWESPITIVTNGLSMEIEKTIEGEVAKAVQKMGVVVDKAELIRALTYDRNQHTKGYEDRDGEIVRCKDCKHRYGDECPMRHVEWVECEEDGYIEYDDVVHDHTMDDGYCSFGERKEQEDE